MPLSSRFLSATRFEEADFRPISWRDQLSVRDAPLSAPTYEGWRAGDLDLSDATPGVRTFSPADPQAFMPPTGGVAGNGLPIYDWDQAAAQLTRESNGWAGLGNPAVVTYGFRSFAGTMPPDVGGFLRFTEVQIAMTIEILALWSEVANITFTRVQDPDGYTNSATMLFGNYTSGLAGASAFAYYPGFDEFAGDVWINYSLETNNSNLFEGQFGPHTMAHEIGHAIGISHPGDYDALDGTDPSYPASSTYWQDGRMFTVMSYFGSLALGGSLNAFASGPQLHDIAAAQRLYGPNMSTRTDDTVYGFNSNTGHAHFTITADGQSPVFAIWDAGGNDTLDFSGYSTAVEIDLRPEAFSSAGPGNGGVGVAIGNVSIARGAIIENGIGGSANDVLIGNNVANLLNGGAGADSMQGGAGDDTYVVDNGNDVVTENASEGADTIRSSVGVAALGANVENLVMTGTAVTGNGNGLNNTITGNASSNFIDGLTGADTMVGLDGNDAYFVDNAGDVVAELSGQGTDVIFSTITIAALAQNVENLTLSGTALNASGNFLSNIITGNAQNNTLNGGSGEDTLAGGFGSDTYIYNSVGDVINEAADAGINDAVIAYIDVAALAANVENLTLAGAAVSGAGNGLNNTIAGNANNNTLTGGLGNDQLNGALGADTLIGGQGDDVYLVENLGDVVIEVASEGNDVVYTWVSISSLAANVERATIIGTGDLNIMGNALANRLYGNEDNNTLSGLDGEDVIGGLGGNDVLIGGAARDLLTGGAGGDTFVYESVSDSGVNGATRDIIYDFTQGEDSIDLAAIDAIAGGSDDAFTFIGTGAFTHTAGELRYEQTGGYTVISMDVNGDGLADSQITLVGTITLTAGDFGP